MKQIEAIHRILRKMRRLAPADGSYGPSRMMEGALVRSEDSASFSRIGFVIDHQLKEAELQKLWDCISRVIKDQRVFYSNTAKYGMLSWQDGHFNNAFGNILLFYRGQLLRFMNGFAYTEGQSGTVEELNAYLKTLKGLQHVFVLTTHEKMDEISANHPISDKKVTFIAMCGEDEYEVFR